MSAYTPKRANNRSLVAQRTLPLSYDSNRVLSIGAGDTNVRFLQNRRRYFRSFLIWNKACVLDCCPLLRNPRLYEGVPVALGMHSLHSIPQRRVQPQARMGQNADGTRLPLGFIPPPPDTHGKRHSLFNNVVLVMEAVGKKGQDPGGSGGTTRVKVPVDNVAPLLMMGGPPPLNNYHS